ncbi:MAG: cytochrome c peroxidase [Phenylobacterium sp.]|jgi:cytochrome c peroxidase
MTKKIKVIKRYFIVNLLLLMSAFTLTTQAQLMIESVDDGTVADRRGPGGPGPGPGGPGPGPGPGGPGPGPGGPGPGGPGPGPGGPGPGPGGPGPGPGGPNETLAELVERLELRPASAEGLDLPSVNDPKVLLGKQLFFTKNLGGEQSAACASCHHPVLGGGDDMSLSVGVNAVNAQDQDSHGLLGIGRFNGNSDQPSVPRNAPTIFNTGLNNRAMFWDSRVEFNRNGDIVTPDSPLNEDGRRLPDQNFPAGTTLAAAQARFPVTSGDEMRGQFVASSDNEQLRAELASRFDNSDSNFSSTWPDAFELAYGDSDVSFNRIADAMGEYERSMVFINNPWKDYLEGDEDAITDQQKAGAMLFFTPRNNGGAGCAGCHRGPDFSSPRHHLVAFPQMGPGKGNDSDTATSGDFGRENITGNEDDRFHFRPPSLLNVAATAPYGHTGAYQTLEQVVAHYNNPRRAINNLFAADDGVPFSDGDDAPFCRLPQVAALASKNDQSCESLYPDAYANSIAVASHLEQANRRNSGVDASSPLRGRSNLSRQEVGEVAAFLRALTDPCVESRECLTPWIIDGNDAPGFPDDQPLIGHDAQEASL